MEPRFLFPHRFKLIGWIIAIPSIILGLFVMFDNLSLDFFTIKVPLDYIAYDGSINEKGSIPNGTELNFTDEIATIGSIVGLLFIAFSKVKFEDEYVSKIRLESLQWAIYLNFALLITATVFVHGLAYYNVTVYNMFTPLIIFIVRFYYLLLVKN
ncbi:MAG: hypothetical protein ACOVO2_18580 [Emticicia sp.]|uniref:Uncharacterized protein n=1 Tax=Emticicia aquatilis TaxID=1537369 RepID=A0A916YRK3_9BACT|nr:hypothetical protein [Emticicia aquatilis]GGD58357.1 hypothetical protein GCM10011514_22970 [Emticicia aquatilis]